MGDREGIGVGGVVAEDRAVVCQCQKSGTIRSGRTEEGSSFGTGERQAVEAKDAGRAPMVECAGLPPTGRAPIARRYPHLVAPGRSGGPTSPSEKLGCRPEGVGHRGDQIAASIAVAIDGLGEERRRQELGLAERAGPGADQPIERDVAALDDSERGDQLLAEEATPTAVAGAGQQRPDQGTTAHDPAIVGFDAPDRHDHVPVDAGPGLDGGQHGVPDGQPVSALGDALGIDHRGEVVLGGEGELGLVPVGEEDAAVRREARGGRIPDRGGDAGRPGGMPNAGEAADQAGARVRRRRRDQGGEKSGSEHAALRSGRV